MRRRLVLVAVVAAVLGLAVAPAFGHRVAQVFSLIDVSGPSTALPPGSFNPNSEEPTPLGARFEFTDALYKWAGRKRGARAGRLEGLCTATRLSLAARSETIFCNATAFLPAGEILFAGHIVFSEHTNTFAVVVIGGTGSYAGARGFVKITNIGPPDSNKSNFEIHLL